MYPLEYPYGLRKRDERLPRLRRGEYVRGPARKRSGVPAGGGNCVMPCNGGSCAMPLDVVDGAVGAGGGGGGGVMVCACDREPARGIDEEPPQRLCADASCAITTTATTMSARRRAIPS